MKRVLAVNLGAGGRDGLEMIGKIMNHAQENEGRFLLRSPMQYVHPSLGYTADQILIYANAQFSLLVEVAITGPGVPDPSVLDRYPEVPGMRKVDCQSWFALHNALKKTHAVDFNVAPDQSLHAAFATGWVWGNWAWEF